MNLIKLEDCAPTWTLRTISEESQENLCPECWKVDGHLIYTHRQKFIYLYIYIIYIYIHTYIHTFIYI